LLTNGIKTDTGTLVDAIFTYITSASFVRNVDLDTFNNNNNIETTAKNFYYVRRNGLGSLRIGSETNAYNFYHDYRERTKSYNTIYIILLIIGIVLPVISLFFLIPIVSSIQRTNNKVLSMFGYIPPD